MIEKQKINSWLDGINKELDEQEILDEHKSKIATWEWNKQKKELKFLNQVGESYIKGWFDDKIEYNVKKIGPEFIGCYFYDFHFWPVIIPLIYGRIKWEPWYSFKSIPPKLLNKILNDSSKYKDLVSFYIICDLYGRRIKRFLNYSGYSRFLKSANDHLKSTITLLLRNEPSSNSIQSSRMSVELFLKSYIDLTIGLTTSKAKRIGHNLMDCLSECLKIDKNNPLKYLKDSYASFPDISDRYEGTDYSYDDMWKAYHCAQQTGAIICRSFTFQNDN